MNPREIIPILPTDPIYHGHQAIKLISQYRVSDDLTIAMLDCNNGKYMYRQRSGRDSDYWVSREMAFTDVRDLRLVMTLQPKDIEE